MWMKRGSWSEPWPTARNIPMPRSAHFFGSSTVTVSVPLCCFAAGTERGHHEADGRGADLVRGLRDRRGDIADIRIGEVVSWARADHDDALGREPAECRERERLARLALERFAPGDLCERTAQLLVDRLEHGVFIGIPEGSDREEIDLGRQCGPAQLSNIHKSRRVIRELWMEVKE